MSTTIERARRSLPRTYPEIWCDGKPITDLPAWLAAHRAQGWPPRARDAQRLARIPAARLTTHALLDAAARGELYG